MVSFASLFYRQDCKLNESGLKEVSQALNSSDFRFPGDVESDAFQVVDASQVIAAKDIIISVIKHGFRHETAIDLPHWEQRSHLSEQKSKIIFPSRIFRANKSAFANLKQCLAGSFPLPRRSF